jgi:hypothetical protein
MVYDQVIRPEGCVMGQVSCEFIGILRLFEGDEERKPLSGPRADAECDLDKDAHLAFGGKEIAYVRVSLFQVSDLSVGSDHTKPEDLIPHRTVMKRSKSHPSRCDPSCQGAALSGRHGEKRKAMTFQLPSDIEKPGTRTHGHLKGLGIDLDPVHPLKVDQDASLGGNRATVSPGPGASQGQGDLPFPGQPDNVQKMFFFRRLEDHVRKTPEQQVTDERREIDVQIVAVIIELLRIVDHPEVGIPAQKLFEVFPPGKLTVFPHLLGPHFFFFEIDE